MEALYEEIGMDKEECYKLIEFVAIATVCDVVDLIDENRIFVKNGLEMLNNSKNIGINALKKACGLEDKEITAYLLGFVIGPCLNASGRLDSAKKGLELLLMEDDEEAKNLAQEIVDLNDARKNMTKEGVDRAINIIDSTDINNDKILVVYIPDIHESLAGIVAGRVKEQYNKPTIILTKSEEGVKGSARSIEEYNMFMNHVQFLESIDTQDVEPLAFPYEVETTFLREDEVSHIISREDALKNAKSIQDYQIKVPKVVK